MAQAASPLRRRHAARLGLILALVLALAQTGAVLHGYLHLRAAGETLPPAPVSSHPCPDCLSFAPLLAAAGATSHSLSVARAHSGTTYRIPVAPLSGQSPQYAFRSRAPPLLA
jgi:hypothetical protein